MKKIVLVVIGLLFLSGSASAFQVNIETRDTLTEKSPSFSLVPTMPAVFGKPLLNKTQNAPLPPLIAILAAGITGSK